MLRSSPNLGKKPITFAMTNYSDEFIKEMPKSDLHLHLDGSLRIPTLIEYSKKLNIELPSYEESGLREQVFKNSYPNLGEYLKGFKYTCAVLRDLEALEQSAYELAIDNQNEGVYYIEVRFAPQLLVDLKKNITMDEVFQSVTNGLDRAKKEFNNSEKVKKGEVPRFNYGIISCAMRMFGPQGFSPYYSSLYKSMHYLKPMQIITMAATEMVRAAVNLRDTKGYPIVGIDLAGQEEGYPAQKFKEVYQYAHKNFMHKTVHAGEAYGAESIFQAITECYAERIGHGYSLFLPERILDPYIKDKQAFINNLASYMADKRTTVEVCLTSNLQTNPEIKNIKEHKFKDMLDRRMATTICTDNRLVSNTTVSKEYRLALDNFNIPIKRLKDMVAYGFKKSFYFGDYVEKRTYAKEVMNFFDKVADKHKVQ